jgi:hypothetical protein
MHLYVQGLDRFAVFSSASRPATRIRDTMVTMEVAGNFGPQMTICSAT